jgi:hypothetical protein
MFRCQLCARVSLPRTPAHRLVVRTRQKKYPYRQKAHLHVYLDERGKRKEKEVDDPGGVGTEIVREVVACGECARNGASH